MVAQRLSIVLPALNEATRIRAALEALAPLRERGHEVILVDGGSTDGTPAMAARLCDRVVSSAPGRGVQMNSGALVATGDALLFLHVDTHLPFSPEKIIFEALSKSAWGRFDVEIEGRHPLLRVVAWSMNLRSRLTGIATGDQGIFVRRGAFAGFPEIALMEDVAFCKAMKRAGPPACLRARVVTSGRRWEAHGVLRTILLMWSLRLRFFLGARPQDLARRYRK